MNKNSKTPKETGIRTIHIKCGHVSSPSNLPSPPKNGEQTFNGTEECEILKVHRHVTPTSILPPPPKKK